MTPDQLRAHIRDVPDFPKPGIVFKDITPLLVDAAAFAAAIDLLAEGLAEHRVQGLVAIESRGFLFAAPLAKALHLPLVLVRKPGKLPSKTVGVDYQLEYGIDRVELHADSILPRQRYAVIDDVIATGGTAAATCRLIETCDGIVACCAFLIELSFLEGAGKLSCPYQALLRY